MLKLIGATAVRFLVPTLMSKLSKQLDGWYDYCFTKEEPEEPKKKRKTSDTTVVTKQMAIYVREYHRLNEGTGQQHSEELNALLGLDKSRAAYTRIWSHKLDVDALPEGDEIG